MHAVQDAADARTMSCSRRNAAVPCCDEDQRGREPGATSARKREEHADGVPVERVRTPLLQAHFGAEGPARGGAARTRWARGPLFPFSVT